MKKITLIACIAIGLSACSNGRDKAALNKVEEQKDLITKLESENDSLKEVLKQIETDKNRNIQHIGNWLDNRPGANIRLILDKNLESNKYYLTMKFDDGTDMKEEVRVTKEKGLMRFQIINSEHVEWYIVEKNGDLSMWSQNGKYGVALCF